MAKADPGIDLEVEALRHCLDALEDLEPEAIARVVWYLYTRLLGARTWNCWNNRHEDCTGGGALGGTQCACPCHTKGKP